MNIVKELDKLEDLYYGEWEESRTNLAQFLWPVFEKANKDEDTANEFLLRTIKRFGGAYIPYLFWVRLHKFIDAPDDERPYIHEILKAFSDADFEEPETHRMKSLIVAYFAMEKEFEITKLYTLSIAKAHPTVKEYFQSQLDFIQKNKKATEVYTEKFKLVSGHKPDFDLLKKPLSELR